MNIRLLLAITLTSAALFLKSSASMAASAPATSTPKAAPTTPHPTNQPVATTAAATAAPPAETNPIFIQLNNIIEQVNNKTRAGKNTEADLAPELKAYDDLIAAHANEKTDVMAEVVYMKAVLYFEVIQNLDKCEDVISLLKKNYPATMRGQQADGMLANVERVKAELKLQASLPPGATFPDFSVTNWNGQPLSVANYKGKVVLIDFWATWCVPCRMELPNVIATYKKHHADGLEIIGVNLDSDRPTMDKFLKTEDGMTWQQYFDGLGWGNKLVAKYGVTSIPFTILIGPDGKIIGNSLVGQALEDAVSRALAKKTTLKSST